MQDWETTRAPGESNIRFRLNGGRWETRRISEEDTVLAEVTEGRMIEIENEGPDIVSIDGRFERTETFEEHNLGETQISGFTQCGHLGAGNREIWRTLEERLYAQARPECRFIPRTEYLRLVRGAEGTRTGPSVERLYRWLFEELDEELDLKAEAIRTSRHDERGRRTPDFVVSLGGIKTCWELKAVLDEKDERIADEQLGTGRNSTLENNLAKAAKQMRASAGEGIPTIVGLVNLRDWDPGALEPDLIADALYGTPVADLRTATITGREARWPDRYRAISAIATLSFQVAVAPIPERGKQLSDIIDGMRMMATLRFFHNARAVTALRAEAVASTRAEQHWWAEAKPRKVLVGTWRTLGNWDGTHEADPTDRSTRGIAGMGLHMMRRAIAEAAAEAAAERPGGRPKDGTTVRIDRHGTVLYEETAPIDETWARFGVPGTQDRDGPVLAGSETTLQEVLKLAGEGVEYETITATADSSVLPEDEPAAAVKTAAAYAVLVLMNDEDRPNPSGMIERVDGRCGGKPVLRGTRHRVSSILELMVQGMTVAEIAEMTEQKQETIREAIEYGRKALARNTTRRGGRAREESR